MALAGRRAQPHPPAATCPPVNHAGGPSHLTKVERSPLLSSRRAVFASVHEDQFPHCNAHRRPSLGNPTSTPAHYPGPLQAYDRAKQTLLF